MLQPANRLTLIDAMRPPLGYCFDAAMAVTFTLDLRALLAAPAAFALTRSTGSVSDDPTSEPIELLHAVRSHAANITVFSQAGEIALPPSRKVFAFLERSVVPVTAPRHGVVHPKVWVLRYRAESAAEECLRVLIASRNLTFDTSWDTILRLDQTTRGKRCRLEPIADMFEQLAERSGQLASDHASRVASLITDLSTASFALPPGVDELHAHVLGFAKQDPPLPTDPTRSMVLSPFVTDDFFTQVWPGSIDELVSRTESLDALDGAALAKVVDAFVFEDGDAPSETDSDDDRLSSEDPGRNLRGLHAKVFAFEVDSRAHLFCGSANATAAAFSSNLEVLIELIGPTSSLGIDRMCDGSGEKGEQSLRQFFATYTRNEREEGDLDPNATSSLDALRRKIGAFEFSGEVEPSGDGWTVTYRTKEVLEAVEGVEVRCWPLAARGNRQLVSGGAPLNVRFEASLDSLSAFLAFELAGAEDVTHFVVPVPLNNMPEERDRHLMRLLIGNAERFLRYLLALLDDDRESLQFLDAIEQVESGSQTDGAPGFTLPVLEKLVRTLRRDPAKLLAIHPLVTDLAAEDALPEGFAELWKSIHTVAVGDGTSR